MIDTARVREDMIALLFTPAARMKRLKLQYWRAGLKKRFTEKEYRTAYHEEGILAVVQNILIKCFALTTDF